MGAAVVACVTASSLMVGGAVAAPRRRAPRTRVAKPLPPLTFVADDGLFRALRAGQLTRAAYSLERARSLFARREARARFGSVAAPDPHDATLLLRDLALRLDQLPPAERRHARRILARPSDGSGDEYGFGYRAPELSRCSQHLCVHWVSTTSDAPPPSSGVVPDQVIATIDTFENVWDQEIDALGFRAPMPDGTSPDDGGNPLLDIYLADVGSAGFYGYCTTDDPRVGRRYDVSAYCVLDNDYTAGQFPNQTPLANLQVTAAHEFFHASQFAYDIFEDNWFMEGTAAWIEDAVYDEVNDNYQYLLSSQLSDPQTPLDLGFDSRGPRYGSWLFWQFLTELLGGAAGADESVIKQTWQWADGAAGAPDQYSLQAAATVARNRGSSLRVALGAFAASNYVVDTAYEEGAGYLAYLGSRPPPSQSFTLDALQATASSSEVLDHLTHAYESFRPGASVSPGAQLELKVDGPNRRRGPVVNVIVFDPARGPRVERISLNRFGKGATTVPFGLTDAPEVVLVLTNASGRYASCGSNGRYACGGIPIDDARTFTFSATLIP